MPSLGADISACLSSVQRPGDFCIGGMRDIVMPTIDVAAVGRLAFPILPGQLTDLIRAAEAAPYGRGEDTIVDRNVRRTWQIHAGKVQIGGRRWASTLADVTSGVAKGLGVGDSVAAEFYKLLIYDEGSFFIEHRDTEKAPRMFATMLLVLPSAHAGGDLVVRHLGREVVFDLQPTEPSEIGFAAFYADCVHEVRPVTAGGRVVLVYNLCFRGKNSPPEPPDYRAERDCTARRLRRWQTGQAPEKLILPLEHAYTPAEIGFTTLKGRDAAVAGLLAAAAADAACDLHVALVLVEESGSADHTGGYSRYEDEEDEFEIIEVCEGANSLSHWQSPDGSVAGFGAIPFDESEIWPADFFAELAPDEIHFHEATGNEGASFERTYRRAGLVLWPSERRLAIVAEAGLQASLPYLEHLAAQWKRTAGTPAEPFWQEAATLASLIIRRWPRASRPHDEGFAASRMLAAVASLANVECIAQFLASVSAEGIYGEPDNAAIAQAAALLPPAQATDLLVRIMARNAPLQPAACANMLRLCGEATLQPVGDLAAIGAALVDALPVKPAQALLVDDESEAAAEPEAEDATPGFVRDLLTALSRTESALAVRAAKKLLAAPSVYSLDQVLLPAILALSKRGESASWPAVSLLRKACLRHLRKRIAEKLEAPANWTRANPVTCTCADCRDLGRFLADPRQPVWRFKAAADRRRHVESNARGAKCDLDYVTERHGSPHVLVATKNQASYERRLTQRNRDLEHLAAMGG